jgi:hypothetical protein
MVFFTDYSRARQAFLSRAKALGASVQSDVHPLAGKQGEQLALDVAIIGDRQAPQRLLVSSGCHGVEGVCGSGIQIAAMHDTSLIAKARAANVSLIFAHALNPYGFSHGRRVTNENVDLNRNFQDFTKSLPINTPYDEIHPLLLPAQWPPNQENQAALGLIIQERGMAYLQAAVSGGQYSHPDGIFFGGTGPTWSNLAVHRLMRSYASGAGDLAWIDLHTGLGPLGFGERIFSSRFEQTSATVSERATELARAQAWWSGNGKTPLTSSDNGSSSSAPLTGVLVGAFKNECQHTRLTKITLEFGTAPIIEVLQALRGEQWAQLNPQAPIATREALSKALLAAFYVDTPQWQRSVIQQGLETMHQAVDGLTTLQ